MPSSSITAQTFRLRMRQGEDDPERLCLALEALARAQTSLDANVNVPLIFQHLTLTLEDICARSGKQPAGGGQ